MASRAPGPSRVARAATRYRPGQAPIHGGDTYSDDEDSDTSKQDARDGRNARTVASSSRTDERRSAGIVLQSGDGPMRDVRGAEGSPQRFQVDKGIAVPQGQTRDAAEDSSEYETDTDDEPQPTSAPRPMFKKPGQPSAVPPAKPDESSEYESDSEEEESEEDEASPEPMAKPIFKSKSERSRQDDKSDAKAAAVAGDDAANDVERVAQAQAEERRIKSHKLAAHVIQQEIAEREADESKPDLDDTDGLDPAAEFAAWKERELARLRREKQALADREAEEKEVERRRAMTKEQRLAEDTQRANQSRRDKKKGEMGFMEKYYHKGSFFQDLDILKKRDYTQATESAVDKRLLPKLMQVRDYGKASRSKWTHLANEDTTKRQENPRYQGMSGASPFSGERDGRAGTAGPGRGANNVPLRPREGPSGFSRSRKRSRSPQ